MENTNLFYGYEVGLAVAVLPGVGEGGAATTGIFSSGPLVCPVVPEIQQLVAPLLTTHQVLSALRPTIAINVPWTTEPVLS